MSGEVISTTLQNGLTVLTQEIHDAPVATFWIWYRVGARNEVPGITGISHWVEHMMFKGTPTLQKGEIFRSVTKNGGTLNGFTWLDFTTYFETLPSDRLELALRIESDRMANSIFDPEEVASERTVIISEREGGENHPTFHLGEEVNAAAFKVHPYGQGVIGWKSDLEQITREDLYGWYRRNYAPNNAVAVVAGDFQTDDLLRKVERHFGGIPSGLPVPPVRSIEPPQQGERRVVVRRPGPTPYLEVAYHCPAASHPDTVPLLVLDAVLSGAKPMGLGGREGGLGRSSRLYRRLVEGGLAVGASSSFALTRDPYLFGISATVRPGVEIGQVESAVFEEVDRLHDSGATEDELAKARKQVRAQLVYGSEGVTSIGYWLGSLEIVHSHTLFDDLLERVDAVTSDDVRRVAATYLGEDNRTVGHLIPTGSGQSGNGGGNGAAPVHAVRPYAYTSSTSATPGKSRLAIQREALPNGIAVLGNESSASPSVVLRAAFRAGSLFDPPGKDGLASFTARMQLRGTKRHTFQQINELTDSLGATLGIDGLTQISQVTFRCLREDFARMVDVVAELMREPTFPEDQHERFRGEVLARLREQANDTGSMAEKAFGELAYPAGHPYARWRPGDERSVGSFTRDDLVSFHRELAQPAGAFFVVAGAVPFSEAVERIRGAFGDWTSSGPARSLEAPPAPRPNGLARKGIGLAGKSQSDVVMGLPAISRKAPAFYALSFADLVLGGLGLMGRLGDVVRDQQGLAYGVSSSLESLYGPGAWQVHAGVNPANVDRAIESIRAEIRRIQDEPITEEEEADGKSYLTGILPLALETSGGVARTIQQIELYDLGLDYVDRYIDIIEGLSKAEVREAARRYMSADDLVVVVAGPEMV